ncbi:hypothetical protein FSHL1_010497 [Fusarium sambucinum]
MPSEADSGPPTTPAPPASPSLTLTRSELRNDLNCATSRLAKQMTSQEKDLTIDEKMALQDLLQRWCAVEQGNSKRRAGTRAWLTIQPQPELGTFNTAWKDGSNVAVNGEHVQLDNGLASAKAAVNFDQAEKARVQGFNTNLVVALARLRILACKSLKREPEGAGAGAGTEICTR